MFLERRDDDAQAVRRMIIEHFLLCVGNLGFYWLHLMRHKMDLQREEGTPCVLEVGPGLL